MKQFLMVSFLLALFANPGWCDILINDGGVYDTVNVGLLDTFVAAKKKDNRSNPTIETNWVNEVLTPTTATYDDKNLNVTYYATNTINTYAFQIGSPPISEYFLVKNATYWALFKNNADMNWGVFDTSLLPSGLNLPSDSFTISHVSRYDAPVSVPEPSIVLLVGGALAGLSFYSRKRGKK